MWILSLGRTFYLWRPLDLCRSLLITCHGHLSQPNFTDNEHSAHVVHRFAILSALRLSHVKAPAACSYFALLGTDITLQWTENFFLFTSFGPVLFNRLLCNNCYCCSKDCNYMVCADLCLLCSLRMLSEVYSHTSGRLFLRCVPGRAGLGITLPTTSCANMDYVKMD